MEFQAVFAWSYEDMPGVDPEKAQHHIDTHDQWCLSSKNWEEWGDFPKPWVGKDGKVYPSWEIFFDEKLTFKEKFTMVIKEMQEKVD